jgi:hypothetical protein
MRRGISRLFSGSIFAGMAFLLCSCGEKGESVPQTGATLDGTVQYGDEPVHFALVIAVGQVGASAQGRISEDGHYHLDNVPLGEVKISVNTPAGEGDWRTYSMNPANKGGGKKRIQVPEKYYKPETTTLKTNINKGPNTYEIKIPK